MLLKLCRSATVTEGALSSLRWPRFTALQILHGCLLLAWIIIVVLLALQVATSTVEAELLLPKGTNQALH